MISQLLNLHSDQLRQNVLAKQYLLDVDIAHLISYDEPLANVLVSNPTELIPLVSILVTTMEHDVDLGRSLNKP